VVCAIRPRASRSSISEAWVITFSNSMRENTAAAGCQCVGRLRSHPGGLDWNGRRKG
jgi:hypothetical protein